jgi:osmotically-inducible protein OsmY
MTSLHHSVWRRSGLTAIVLAAAVLGSGCAALVVGAGVGVGMSMTDRRTTGAQIDDQLIELKARNRVREVLPDSGNVNVTSFNRVLLLTGEVPTEANKIAIEETTSKIDNLKSVVNELAVRDASAFSSRSSDTVVTSKVKATFVDARAFPINAVKIVTERGIVYLLGRVTEAEATKASDLARSVGGVMKVVRVFEIISQGEADTFKHDPKPAEQPKT